MSCSFSRRFRMTARFFSGDVALLLRRVLRRRARRASVRSRVRASRDRCRPGSSHSGCTVSAISRNESTSFRVLISSPRNRSPVNDGFCDASRLMSCCRATSRSHARPLLLGQRLHPLIAILLLQRQPDLLEPRIPQQPPQRRIVRPMQKPDRLRAKRPERQHRIEREHGRRQRPAEQRKIVRIGKRHLQIRPLLEDRLLRKVLRRLAHRLRELRRRQA